MHLEIAYGELEMAYAELAFDDGARELVRLLLELVHLLGYPRLLRQNVHVCTSKAY